MKYPDPDWAHGHPHPRNYASWRDWINAITWDVIDECETTATLGKRLRPVQRTDLEQRVASAVHGKLEEALIGTEVDQEAAIELIIMKVVDRLEKRGYVVA